MILPHHPTFFVDDDAFPGYSSDGQLREKNLYWMCLNYRRLHESFSSYPIVVPFTHLHQFDSEDSYEYDDATYAWKDHYYRIFDDSVTTFGVIDADETGVTITTIDHATGDRTVVDPPRDANRRSERPVDDGRRGVESPFVERFRY